MKKSELRQIIREEISKIIEEEGFDYSHFKYVEGDLYNALENLENIESKVEKYGPISNDRDWETNPSSSLIFWISSLIICFSSDFFIFI